MIEELNSKFYENRIYLNLSCEDKHKMRVHKIVSYFIKCINILTIGQLLQISFFFIYYVYLINISITLKVFDIICKLSIRKSREMRSSSDEKIKEYILYSRG